MIAVFNRRVMLTTLDPVPRAFRACPGVIVLNCQELEAFRRGDRNVVEQIIDICQAEDAAEARGVYRYKGSRSCR